LEAQSSKYFADGLLIKHCGIYPIGFDKDNLLEDQKVFLAYLLGVIPSLEDWSVQVDYKIRKEEIQKINIKDIKLTKTDIDLAKLQGNDIDEIKKEKLKLEKQRKLRELKDKFGIKEEKEKEDDPIVIDSDSVIDSDNPNRLWDMLQMKNLVKPDKENG
jgi:hypothetical protein